MGDAGDRFEDDLARCEVLGHREQGLDRRIDPRDLLIEEGDGAGESVLHQAGSGCLGAGSLDLPGFDEVDPAMDQGGELSVLMAGWRVPLQGFPAFRAVLGEHHGVDPVGLGAPERAGEGADPASVAPGRGYRGRPARP